MSYSGGSWRRSLLVAAALVAGGTAVAASSPGAVAREAAPDATGQAWVGSWSTTPLVGSAGFNDQTLREIIHISLGGDEVRIRLTNAFGADGVVVDDVTVGVRDAGAALAPGTERPVTFGGVQHVTLPAGAEVLSDPVPLAVAPQQDLAVSLHVPAPTGPATRHAGAYTTSYAASGDHAAEPSASAFTSTLSSWYLLDGVDVLTAPETGAVVALGDSITDGTNSTVDANRRYPDDLARRLLAGPPGQLLGVLNEGASGNRLLTDGGSSGVSAQQRFDRDVLAQTGVRAVILLEGINDIGHDLGPVSANPVTAQDLIDAMSNLTRAAHEHGLRIIGATMTPIGGSKYDTPDAEARRQAVNEWIRTGGAFDGVVDFDRTARDPADPSRFLPAYDSGDHLHPNDIGYQAMADAVDLNLLYRRLTRAADLADGTVYLSRIETNRFPDSQVAFIDTTMDAHVRPVGWQITPNDCSLAPRLRFWEHHSVDLTGAPVDVTQRLACSRQIGDAEAAQWRDPSYVLGGWVPALVPPLGAR